MSLSATTRFLVHAGFVAAQIGQRPEIWFAMAEQSHGPVVTADEWNEVRDMIRTDFPDLIDSQPRLRRWVDSKEPHPCECGSH